MNMNVSSAATPAAGGSSLMSWASGERLTVELLAMEIPVIRTGEQAVLILDLEGDTLSVTDRARYRELQREVKKGERAKEHLLAAALPLIRNVAVREFRRRQQWNSRVPVEDLMQEAVVGFFKGLAGFKPEAVRKSATNYLGQWMLVEMRRAAEVMDHDLQVGHDAGERFRRVRALRSRLLNDLERDPTDEEISDASRNPHYVTRPGLVGRAPLEGEKSPVGKGLTVAQVAEERTSRDRVGHMVRLASATDEDGEAGLGAGFIDSDRIVAEAGFNIVPVDPANLVADTDGLASIAGLIRRVLVEMRLPPLQAEIIIRRYGLAPFEEESSARKIALAMGVHRERVSKVLSAFATEMTEVGGVFHLVVAELSSDEMYSLDLGWLHETLGSWDSAVNLGRSVSPVLTERFEPRNAAEPAEAAPGEALAAEFAGHYQCDFEDVTFITEYTRKIDILDVLECPGCRRPAELFRTVKTPQPAS